MQAFLMDLLYFRLSRLAPSHFIELRKQYHGY